MRLDIQVMVTTGTGNFHGAGTQYLVHANNGAIYLIMYDNQEDVIYKKSTDGGKTWGNKVSVFTGTTTALAIWYDRWSGLSTDYIHLVYAESVTDDTLYRTINTGSSDALSTQTTIFLGASTATGGHLSVTRAVGGNVYCKTCIDNGAEGGFFRLPNANVPNGAWDAARTINEANASADQIILQPDLTAADTNDIIAIFWDASADELSRQLYDDSANSWSETSISTAMVDNAATNGFPHFDAAPDLTNSQIVVVAWNGVDTANQDLKCWTVTNSAITAKTDVVTNGTDDQGLAAISIDTDNANHWRVFYGGQSDGSETWSTDINIYRKDSMDAGSTWGPETQQTNMSGGVVRQIRQLYTIPRTSGDGKFAYNCNLGNTQEMYVNTEVAFPRAAHQILL